MQYLNNLNNEQKTAVTHQDGPLLILAGAGAGKTRVITYRILHLIHSGVSPNSILAVTFTNKAAKEMRERVINLINEQSDVNRPVSMNESPYVSTFHALGVHILRENFRELNISKHFAIFDRSDSIRTVRQAIKDSGYDTGQFEPKKILGTISKQKGEGVSCSSFEATASNDYYRQIVSDVWKKYEKTLNDEKAFDFDDLLLKTAELLRTNKQVRDYYQSKWKYIHIDEYQDTNKVQNEIATHLSSLNNNICVVGDVDQTIYTWRGADISNMLHFEKDYPETTTVLLEENYRSTKTIITASNRIIEKNNNRPEKNLFTNNENGEKITIFNAYGEIDEAYFVTSKAKEIIDSGVNPKEIAVLYRANFQSRILEEAFLGEGVPYQVLGTRFFDRKEVKDILSFIRLTLNPDSITDLKRIMNVPPRGIGKVTLLRIVAGQEEECSPAMRQKIADFREMIRDIRKVIDERTPSEVIKFILKISGLEEVLQKGNEEDKERLENIRELVTLAKKYDALPLEEGLEKLMTDAALATDQDELSSDNGGVKLMTVHAAKGLEFDYVFITGLEEGLFPHQRMGESKIDNEEERRLFYVALTRARKKLFLSFTSVRTIFGSQQVNVVSEFITDIDDELVESNEQTYNSGSDGGEKMEYLDLNDL